MTPIAEPTTDEDFEAEVRAMLARRAGDVSPSPAPHADVAALSSVDAPRRPVRPRLLAAAAAIVVLAAGVGAVVMARDPDGPSTTTLSGAEANDPIVWPLDDHVPPTELAAPETAAAAYLAEVVGDIDLTTVEAPVVDGARATVGYRLGDVPGHVALLLDSGRWGVTGATSDAVSIDGIERVDGRLEVMTSLGDAVVDGTALVTSSVDADGVATVRNTTGVVLVDAGVEVPLEPTEGPATTLLLPPDDPSARSIAVELGPADPPAPVAVRVDVVAPDDGDPSTPDVVIGHASRALDRPDDEDQPPPSSTSTTSTAEHGEAPVDDAVDAPGEGTPDDVVPPSDALYVGSGTAAEVAQHYLDDRVPERAAGLRLVPEAGAQAGTGGGEVVDVPWEIAGDPEAAGRYSGVIRLRSDAGGWSVIGATTDQITATIRRDDEGAAVTIEWRGGLDAVDVILLDADGLPVSDAEFVMFATPGETVVRTDRGVDPSDVRSVLVRHVGGTWFSITEVRLP